MVMRVMVVDDDETFGMVLARALERRGLNAICAATGEVALELARVHLPGAVVLDLNLGNASGLNLIRPLLEIAPQCRIVVLTGYASIATAVEAIKLGATQYFAKPVEVETIVAAFAQEKVAAIAGTVIPSSDPLSVGRLEWEHIQRVLHEHGENISATARALNMHRRTLQRILAKRAPK